MLSHLFQGHSEHNYRVHSVLLCGLSPHVLYVGVIHGTPVPVGPQGQLFWSTYMSTLSSF